MLPFALTYLFAGLLTVAALSFMILKIGALMSDCPVNGSDKNSGKNSGKNPAARTAAITIATGFAAIGTGGVLLIGAVLPLLAEMPELGVALGLGFASLCLGLGFTQAIATLRAVLNPPVLKAPTLSASTVNAPMPEPSA